MFSLSVRRVCLLESSDPVNALLSLFYMLHFQYSKLRRHSPKRGIQKCADPRLLLNRSFPVLLQVSLGNVLAASYGAADKPVPFIAESDQHLFKALKGEAFEVQVGVHELLGHGSGKLFHQDTPEAAQLVEAKFVCPIRGEPITGPFYAPGSTWDSTFGKIASAYEECRAECAGLYLCLESEVLGVFGHGEMPAEA